jgi:phenylacetate-coenzyme A ligase PaaK-like adenylate-forming protein
MPQFKALEQQIFKLQNPIDFDELAIELFELQYHNNRVYKQFCDLLNKRPSNVSHVNEIPFLPVEFFKNHAIKTGNFDVEIIFSSSGTTRSQASYHHVKDVVIYENSFLKGFHYFFGNPEKYIFLALLPSYLEREGSSLIYMVKQLISLSRNEESGFYLNEYQKLSEQLTILNNGGKKVILFGVTYALMEFAEQFPTIFPELIVMETGGMKGKRKEIVRDELHGILKKGFGTENIFSEYGMTELLSQSYSLGNGLFETPPWMKILIRDTNDPLTLLPEGKTGCINIIDLANMYSCSFISTQDLGKKHENGKFEVLGRFDNSDVRGCNLLVG